MVKCVMENATFENSFDGLFELISRLRGPTGCSWDREQSRESMKKQLLEEVYELIDAIEEGNPLHIAEEVGDVLAHMAFQIVFGVENDEFSIGDIFRLEEDKLIRRHPHVFSEASAKEPSQVAAQWEEIKRDERGRSKSVLAGVTMSLPALALAQALQERAARVGFDWEDVGGVVDKVREELDELVNAKTSEERESELGDVLFSLVNMARWLNVDAEDSLRRAGIRFQNRFAKMEHISDQSGLSLEKISISEQDLLWSQAKLELSDLPVSEDGAEIS